MKVEIFTPVVYYGHPVENPDWPFAPRLFDSERGVLSMERGLRQCEAAHAAGFDSLNFAEHHYSTSQMTPAPLLFAAALGQRVPGAQIAIMGTDLPLHNPVNVAEQYATLDNLLGGRLRFALLRGTPNEYMTYGTNPWEFVTLIRMLLLCRFPLGRWRCRVRTGLSLSGWRAPGTAAWKSAPGWCWPARTRPKGIPGWLPGWGSPLRRCGSGVRGSPGPGQPGLRTPRAQGGGRRTSC